MTARTRPFRIGTTSCIWHDYMLPNVEKLAPLVDDVELLLFDVERDVPSADDVARMVALKREHALSYTLHTPLDASLASADEHRRRRGVDKVRRAIEWARPLEPLACTVHVYLGDRERDPTPVSDLDAWRDRAHASLATLAREVGPRALSVETIDYDFALIAPVVRALDLSVALDLGHALRDRLPLAPLVDEWLDRARVLQLHGTRPQPSGAGRDHKSLALAPRTDVTWLLETLLRRQFGGVLTLEVFDGSDFAESLALVRSLVD